jgi:hypothetical protein
MKRSVASWARSTTHHPMSSPVSSHDPHPPIHSSIRPDMGSDRRKQDGYETLWIESICEDPGVIAHNVAQLKEASPDYVADHDFERRIAFYKKDYVHVDVRMYVGAGGVVGRVCVCFFWGGGGRLDRRVGCLFIYPSFLG